MEGLSLLLRVCLSGLRGFVKGVLGFGLLLGADAVQAALSPGDVSIIGFRSDDNDGLSFVTWVEIEAGTTLYFTDSGFFDDGTLRASEKVMSWTVPSGGISTGTVVVITCPKSENSSANIGSTSGIFDGLSASGDQLFIGTTAFPSGSSTNKPGSAYTGTLLYGLNFDTSTWAADATSSNTSDLPDSLDGTYLNLAIAEADNGEYSGLRSGLKIEEFKAAIHDADNWTTENEGSVFGALNSTSFTDVVPTSSGIDLRAFQGQEGVVVEFAAYDVEADGEIRLMLQNDDGDTAWTGTVEVAAGPEVYARFYVPGLELGKVYCFRVRDEVGKWWDAPGVKVQPFAAEMVSASPAGIELTFDSRPNHEYEVQWIPELGSDWQTVTSLTATGAETALTVPHPDPEGPTGFFRVRLK